MAQGVCKKCGKEGQTHKHHIDGTKEDRPGNLIEVCPKCHGALHRELNKKEKSRLPYYTVHGILQRSRLVKIGGSVYIRVPKEFRIRNCLNPGEKVRVSVDGHVLRVTRDRQGD